LARVSASKKSSNLELNFVTIIAASRGAISGLVNTDAHRCGAEGETTMKQQKMRDQKKAAKPAKGKSEKRKLPYDPDGTFKRAAARGMAVMEHYRELNPGLGDMGEVSNILFDLINFCDRVRGFEDFDEAHAWAVDTYETFKTENEEGLR
jgi:hypothetical protein